jgi:DNA polymerase-3 subunit gamma/tau
MANYKVLEEVKGQPRAIHFLRKYNGHREILPSVFLFHGPEGVGKWFTAERFIKQILCLNGDACDICESCRAFHNQTHPDFIQFSETESIKMGDEKNPEPFSIRWLQSVRIPFKPYLSDRRVILIPNVARLLHESETALLKTLEDCPNHTIFIMISHDLSRVRQTIISRSICVPFHYISTRDYNQERESEFFTGTYNLSPIPKELREEIFSEVREYSKDSVLILDLEMKIKGWKEEISKSIEIEYRDILDLITTYLIFHYKEIEQTKREQLLEIIYSFKESLRRNINGLEPFLFSKLIYQLSLHL